MKVERISVPLSVGEYDILVGCRTIASIGQALRQRVSLSSVVILTHPRVNRLYGEVVQQSLVASGFSPSVLTLPSGEQYKTLSSVARAYDFLVKRRFERGSLLLALGGGVIGDMTGFVAATFLRGVSYVQIPTTVVAQVDASIGGKTGVDHPLGKNLIGAFHQPRLVFIDPETLLTLSKREYVAGLAEVVKYGVISDAAFFEYLEDNGSSLLGRQMKTVRHCVVKSASIKARVVAVDERESGLRRILNYGHTWGHAIETITSYRRYKHGEAVAMGMQMAARLSHFLGILSEGVVDRQGRLLKALGLPTMLPKLDPEKILDAMLLDKKVKGGEIFFVLPEKIGSVCVDRVSRQDLKRFLNGVTKT